MSFEEEIKRNQEAAMLPDRLSLSTAPTIRITSGASNPETSNRARHDLRAGSEKQSTRSLLVSLSTDPKIQGHGIFQGECNHRSFVFLCWNGKRIKLLSKPMKKHFSIIVKGRVQGVWYRKSTKDKADELGLKGYVRNMADGSVYIEVEGDDSSLKAIVKWCWSGPELSRVDSVSVEESGLKHFESFEILR